MWILRKHILRFVAHVLQIEFFAQLYCALHASGDFEWGSGRAHIIVGIFKHDNRKLNWTKWIDNRQTIVCCLDWEIPFAVYKQDNVCSRPLIQFI